MENFGNQGAPLIPLIFNPSVENMTSQVPLMYQPATPVSYSPSMSESNIPASIISLKQCPAVTLPLVPECIFKPKAQPNASQPSNPEIQMGAVPSSKKFSKSAAVELSETTYKPSEFETAVPMGNLNPISCMASKLPMPNNSKIHMINNKPTAANSNVQLIGAVPKTLLIASEPSVKFYQSIPFNENEIQINTNKFIVPLSMGVSI